MRRDSVETSLVSLLGRLRTFGEPPVPQLAFNSLIFGLEVACGILVISWLVPRDAPMPFRRNSRGWGWLRRPAF